MLHSVILIIYAVSVTGFNEISGRLQNSTCLLSDILQQVNDYGKSVGVTTFADEPPLLTSCIANLLISHLLL